MLILPREMEMDSGGEVFEHQDDDDDDAAMDKAGVITSNEWRS